jgi:tetratricopeptide (TPR) repeat protein
MAIDKNAVIKEAQKFVAKGQFDKAIAEWKKLVREFPNDANIFNTIGDLCLKKDAKADAVDAYKKAADILAADGFTSKAIALYKKVLNIDPKKIEAHLALADLNAEKGLTGNALESYKLVADHYKQNQEMAKALGIYQKMADLNPSNSAFRLKLADMYAKEGMKKEAVKAYLEVADVHMSKEAYQDARQIFEKALALDPNSKKIYHKAGIVYYKEGKYVEACKALKPAFEGDPSNKELIDMYLDALAKAGRDVEAEEIYKKLLSEDATRIDLREKLFHLYLARKEHDKALAEARIIAEARLKDRAAAGEKGLKMLPGTGEAELDEEANAALENLKGLVAENPGFAEARRTLGDFYAKVGRGRDAAAEFVQAAEILIGAGDKDGAKGALARAIELAPDSTEAKQRLESLLAPPPPAPEPAPVVVKPAVTPPAPLAAGTTPAAPVAEEDPAIADAFTEVDVLVKYGLSAKALEQLEGLAKKFPESVKIRIKLRDLYGDQGNVGKAVAHMLVLADLYAKSGVQDQAESVLQTALELDPGNAEVQSRLGMVPSESAQAPAAPGELTFEEPLAGAPSLDEVLPSAEVQPAAEITTGFEGLDMTPPELGEELVVPGPAERDEPAFVEPAKEPSVSGEITFEEPLVPDFPMEGQQPPLEEATAVEPQKPVSEEHLEQPFGLETEPEVPAQEPPAQEADLKEIWAEAEFYYQQGLFDEAKKHYAKIIQHDPSDTRAIDRLTEISREAVETQEFSKLADAVDELEGYVGGDEAGEELAASESDDEAVRSLMQEITQLKQQQPAPSSTEDVAAPAPPEAPPVEEAAVSESDDEAVRLLMQEIAQLKQQTGAPSVEAAVPPKAPAADTEMIGTAVPGRTDVRQKEQRPEEDFFDLGEELRESGIPTPKSERKEQAVKSTDDFFDLASELRDELSSVSVPPPSSTSAEEQSLDDIFEEFKKGVEQQAVKEDVDTHYNLGVAYKEMGLLDDAIAEFVLTPEQEPKFVQSRYMLGLCYMDKGEYQNAIAELQNALNYSENFGVDVRERIGLYYDLGLAYQLAGDAGGALKEFQKVYDVDPGYRDAASKIKELQKGDFISLEQLKDDIEKEISFKFLEEGERIEREEKIRKNEKVRS